jgi:hypothetical protein
VKITDLISKMQHWEDHADERDGSCVKCGEPIGCSEPEYEPSPLCNLCAQDLATRALPGRVQRLETELVRAAGIARARGANNYADDFMRVAQDREDFDAEVTTGATP